MKAQEDANTGLQKALTDTNQSKETENILSVMMGSKVRFSDRFYDKGEFQPQFGQIEHAGNLRDGSQETNEVIQNSPYLQNINLKLQSAYQNRDRISPENMARLHDTGKDPIEVANSLENFDTL
jgi:hypothetical protein